MYLYLIPPLYILAYLLFFLILNWWLGHAFAGYREMKKWRRILFFIVYLFSASPVLGCFLPDSSAKFFLTAVGNIWLGYFLYVGLIAIPLSIIAGAAGLMRGERTRRSRITARLCLIIALAGALGVNLYGSIHARDVQVHEIEVTLDKRLRTEGGKDTLRAALIADLHMSVNSRPETIQRMVDLLNEQEPDLVFAAGDFLTSTYYGLKDPERYAEILRGIRSRYGSYAVYGNHDVEEPLLGGFPMTPISEAFRSEEIVSFIDSCGFRVMSDEVEEIVGGTVVLVGREDGEKSGNGTEKRLEAEELMDGIDLTKPVLVLEHEPMDFENLSEAGADLVLSGHTHAGQIFPGNLITPFFNANNYGLKTLYNLQSVVTSGVGFYGPPLRVGTDSEIMMVTIHFA
jgi:predicted MPP superfamily phosphohydrolase